MVSCMQQLTQHTSGRKNLCNLADADLFVCAFSRTVWFKWLVHFSTILTKPLPMTWKAFINKVVANDDGAHTGTAAWLCLDWAWIICLSIANSAGGSSPTAVHFSIACMAMAILSFIVLFVMPCDGEEAHGLFELTHQCRGWLFACLFAVDLTILLFSGGDDHFALEDTELWLVIASIFLAICPWLGILKVHNAPVHVFTPSDGVAIVSWTPGPWFSAPGTAGQLAFELAEVKEHHSFALFDDFSGDPTKVAMAVAKVGDWTSQLIEKGKEAVWHEANDAEAGDTHNNLEPNCKLCRSRVAAPGFMCLIRNCKQVV